MESKLNNSSIEAYSVSFASKICSGFFVSNTFITGQQILNLCSIRQINLFVLKNLFTEWKQETEKLKSPYFDFQASEVQKSFEEFKNMLSQNIKINRQNFEPLLRKAVQECILLLFSPYDFFQKEIFIPTAPSVSLDSIKETAKYIKINKHLSESLIRQLDKKKSSTISREEGIEVLNEVCEQTGESPEDFDEYIARFSEVQPLSVDIIYSEAVQQIPQPEAKPGRDFFSESLNNFPSDEAPPVPNINDKFSKKQATLNDLLHEGVRSTIADIHLHRKIESIRQSLTINQKFMFIKELFKGNTDEFNRALQNLDHCGNYNEAMSYLQENYATKHNWNMEGEEVDELISLIQRKYNGNN